ncbi:hypothetical protein OPV22_005546 [Ensete ventricosum]|uniref:Uncharacterized protein n=1 Tax=Ensete ventricosum TaxID=4639 RepID=A0AAV8RRQ0_ENSVE|nr:hypothetical protein OPV22_005546 [Ensete ventricosum]
MWCLMASTDQIHGPSPKTVQRVRDHTHLTVPTEREASRPSEIPKPESGGAFPFYPFHEPVLSGVRTVGLRSSVGDTKGKIPRFRTTSKPIQCQDSADVLLGNTVGGCVSGSRPDSWKSEHPLVDSTHDLPPYLAIIFSCTSLKRLVVRFFILEWQSSEERIL